MATKLSRDDVLRVAALAHLTLTDAEVDVFARQLAGILDWVAAVDRADTAGVEPTSHVGADLSVWREDEPSPSLAREDALHASPDADRQAGLFRVPAVL
jgi:aspartyl-tRNA(Asn)/glutamyl-tRNA(Gln) amidotransferase subunit C